MWKSLLLTFLCCFLPSRALYEDQVFKFDWRRQYVGIPLGGKFWETDKDSSFVVHTSSNALAALDSDSGQIRWRHVFENDETGSILDVGVTDRYVISISGRQFLHFRYWNPMTGALANEVYVQPSFVPDMAFIHGGQANLLQFTPAGVKLESYDLKKGTEIGAITFSSGSEDRLQCISTKDFLVCLSLQLQMAYYTPLPFAPKAAFNAIQLSQLGMGQDQTPVELARVHGTRNKVQITTRSENGDEQLMSMDLVDGKVSGVNFLRNQDQGRTVMTGCKNTDEFIIIEQSCAEKGVHCRSYHRDLKITKMRGTTPAHEVVYRQAEDRGRLATAWASCEEDQDGTPVYQLVLQGEDGSLQSLTPSVKLMWVREEALSGIQAVELMPFGLDDDDGTYDSENTLHGGDDILERFVRRIRHHASQLQMAFTHIVGMKDLGLLAADRDSTMDNFGIRKIVIAVTDSRKIYGIDSKSGDIVWQTMFHGSLLTSRLTGKTVPYLFIQRNTHHFNLDPLCTIIYNNPYLNLPEVMSFNPLTGKVQQTTSLSQPLKQAILLGHECENHVRPILLLGRDKPQLFPETAASHLKQVSGKVFLATLDEEGTISGQRLTVTEEGGLFLTPVWNMASPGTTVLQIVSKPVDERVHSQGRVMADRSVLFKYVNPNLALVLTEGKDAAQKTFINIFLVDLITGRIVFSATHKRVAGPYHVVHSENWAVYSFYNEKARRTEMASLELFEGKTQQNSTVFSSLKDTVTPLVDRQAYILTFSTVAAMKDTVTEKAITSKHILVATGQGQIYDIPRALLDPRRPNINTPMEMREPGLPPYIPELQMPPEAILNYNQTLESPRGIVTSPTGLESTSVVLVYGLDVYCTSVTPSKGFDLLKEDFDYFIIASVLAGLVLASYITRKLAQRKNIKQAWR